ncbi:putative ATPase ECM3 KNAG_0H03280 [Huiozyma naganishii CBS 8797]|uniref:Auxin efflux carrier component n=1 Tax=Huiozyma naganishii (strain ATCC MYA-139 / BCRC 22969 / CBS 8797 / KCTC 17520 / NBRC 10181 / NCYC 3082 / Yp74L-3) TaxID=1071383 RepID=J7RPS4_HUIN7|nr:hypothetical protein KNAG_0H03280 [Kazachstania naganishii CBS 8797]CCK71743.1 hypothetical protein KNAG_0H03280 [Kazachstania naganishii CBS 8797]
MVHITLGQAIWASVKPIIKIYLIIGVGFLLAKLNILTAEATRYISDIVLTVLLPCLAFNKIVANIEDQDIKSVGIICLTSVILFLTGLFFAYVVRRCLWVPKEWGGGILAGGMFPNISDLPIAYIQTMDQGFIFTPEEGEKGVANVIIFLAMFLICVFNLGGFRLIENDFHYHDEENGIRDSEMVHSISSGSSMTHSSENGQDMDESASNFSPKELPQNSSEEDDIDEKSQPNQRLPSKDNGHEKIIPHSQSSSDTPVDPLQQPVVAHTRGGQQSNPALNSSPSLRTTESLPGSSIITPIFSDEASLSSDLAGRTLSQPIAYTSQEDAYRLDRDYHHHHHRHQNQSRDSELYSGNAQHLHPNFPYTYQQNELNRSVSIRSIDTRDLPAQNMQDIIHEYSNVDQYGKRRRSSVTSDVLSAHISATGSQSSALQRIKTANLTKILTSDATVSKKDISESGSSLPNWLRKFPLTPFIVFFIKNCLRPCSMAVILALIIAFIPWVKALFVTTKHTPKIKQAPDQQPALSFFMDFSAYIGAASVPFGLMLLGATLGRLKIGKLYPGFWKSACVLVFLRQCIMPIFGVLWCDRLVKAGWLNWESDKMLLFVIAITWDLPTMTTLIYFTASYTPVDATNPIQMECVSFFLMIQYPLMVVSLPFLVSYFLKVQMKL